ncbi:hypothetical protein [Acidocella sp.]|uniref:hypothetical protein n=1 Tax=Acidocella sp. TaxID=50710 RepID=UPI0026206EA0|nr:hypothetical protein [Acidocella sp.]
MVEESNERLVCAILAEQVSNLRDRMDASEAFDLLWQTSALLSWLAGLLADITRDAPKSSLLLDKEISEAISKITTIRHQLDALAFFQAQRQDFARQIADCVITALERMSSARMPEGSRFASADLAALYVSDDQRRLHEDVLNRLQAG